MTQSRYNGDNDTPAAGTIPAEAPLAMGHALWRRYAQSPGITQSSCGLAPALSRFALRRVSFAADLQRRWAGLAGAGGWPVVNRIMSVGPAERGKAAASLSMGARATVSAVSGASRGEYGRPAAEGLGARVVSAVAARQEAPPRQGERAATDQSGQWVGHVSAEADGGGRSVAPEASVPVGLGEAGAALQPEIFRRASGSAKKTGADGSEGADVATAGGQSIATTKPAVAGTGSRGGASEASRSSERSAPGSGHAAETEGQMLANAGKTAFRAASTGPSSEERSRDASAVSGVMRPRESATGTGNRSYTLQRPILSRSARASYSRVQRLAGAQKTADATTRERDEHGGSSSQDVKPRETKRTFDPTVADLPRRAAEQEASTGAAGAGVTVGFGPSQDEITGAAGKSVEGAHSREDHPNGSAILPDWKTSEGATVAQAMPERPVFRRGSRPTGVRPSDAVAQGTIGGSRDGMPRPPLPLVGLTHEAAVSRSPESDGVMTSAGDATAGDRLQRTFDEGAQGTAERADTAVVTVPSVMAAQSARPTPVFASSKVMPDARSRETDGDSNVAGTSVQGAGPGGHRTSFEALSPPEHANAAEPEGQAETASPKSVQELAVAQGPASMRFRNRGSVQRSRGAQPVGERVLTGGVALDRAVAEPALIPVRSRTNAYHTSSNGSEAVGSGPALSEIAQAPTDWSAAAPARAFTGTVTPDTRADSTGSRRILRVLNESSMRGLVGDGSHVQRTTADSIASTTGAWPAGAVPAAVPLADAGANGTQAGSSSAGDVTNIANQVYDLLVRRLASERQRRGM